MLHHEMAPLGALAHTERPLRMRSGACGVEVVERAAGGRE